ncbi:MAG: hypothetical protein IPO43_17285 [Rhodoferax sp.]|nr:hypothetical protein [Rhodoferax sp.]
MNREDLEHIIRASGEVTDQYEFIIVGSQSILGSISNPQDVFKMSAEADIYPYKAPELADKIDGAIGEASPFHETYGYYAQGVGPETAVLPSSWFSRVHRVQNSNTNDRVGYCLDVLDLFMSKAAAGRHKDREFCMALLQHHHVTLPKALSMVAQMPVDEDAQRRLRATIRRWANALREAGHQIAED